VIRRLSLPPCFRISGSLALLDTDNLSTFQVFPNRPRGKHGDAEPEPHHRLIEVRIIWRNYFSLIRGSATAANLGAPSDVEFDAYGNLYIALNGIFTLVEPEYNAQGGQPFPLELYLSDDCGAPVTSGAVVASFQQW
jgi:hypothetical protein